MFHELSLVDEIKIYVKVYSEKLEKFKSSVFLGVLLEIPNVKQYFSNEMNFVFRSDYRPDLYKIHPTEETFDHEMTFKQRLRILNSREAMQETHLSKISPFSLMRQTIKVIVSDFS